MNSWQTYALTPLDTLFIRDGRPFDASEGSDVHSFFPPTPFTIQGVVRSKLLSKPYGSNGTPKGEGCGRFSDYKSGCVGCPHDTQCNAQDVVGKVGSSSGKFSVEVRGPLLLRGAEPLLPLPLDVIAETDSFKKLNKGSTVQTDILRPAVDPSRCSNLPGGLHLLKPRLGWKDFKGVQGWVTWDRFQEYLKGCPPVLRLQEDWWPSSDLFAVDELRPGLEMEQGRNRSKEGHLYFARHVRLQQEVALGVEVCGLGDLAGALDQPSAVPLGGERRAARLERVDSVSIRWRDMPDELKTAISKEEKKEKNFKLVLLQPAWFTGGWRPGGWNEKTGEALLPPSSTSGLRCDWIAARIERPEKCGGWNLAMQRPRPVGAFVPRGSVYYLKLQDVGDVENLCKNLWNTCISETPGGRDREPFPYNRLGFGHVLIGTW